MKTLLTFLFIGFIATTTSAVATNIEASFPQAKPIETIEECFKHFRVYRLSSGNTITWSVSSKDVIHFIIERSYDGKNFEPRTDMTCAGLYLHSFTDKTLSAGTIYYKVAAIKSDGTKEYSIVETINTAKE
ncbi:MAG: hypothetical protein ABR503_06290 [Chitinophagaceae bacterium]